MANDVLEYYIGKGVVTFAGRDLGNVPEFELTPELETLDHFSSREGVKKKDKSVVLSKSMTVRIVIDNWSIENLKLLLLGGTGSSSFEIFSTNSIEGELVFTGANEIGPKVTITLYNVSFKPGSSINLLSEEWGQIELSGEALVDSSGGANDGKFGTLAWVVSEEAA